MSFPFDEESQLFTTDWDFIQELFDKEAEKAECPKGTLEYYGFHLDIPAYHFDPEIEKAMNKMVSNMVRSLDEDIKKVLR